MNRDRIYCRMCKRELSVIAEYTLKFVWDTKLRTESLCNMHLRERMAYLKKNYYITCEVSEQLQPIPMLWS
jgi:hypothetical protein